MRIFIKVKNSKLKNKDFLNKKGYRNISKLYPQPKKKHNNKTIFLFKI